MTEETAIRFLMMIVDGEAGAGNPEVDLARIAAPYYAFRDFSEVVFATPSGGPPMLSDTIRADDLSDEAVRRFKGDRSAREELADTLGFDQIVVEDFAAAFCIGFSGNIWNDGDNGVAALVRAFLGARKPVALVPGKHLLLAPAGAGNGLLILADSDESPLCAARVLINVVADARRSCTI